MVFAGNSGFLHYLQLAMSRIIATIWHKCDEKRNSKDSRWSFREHMYFIFSQNLASKVPIDHLEIPKIASAALESTCISCFFSKSSL